MVREARRKSTTGIYHVMLRGINRQVIFEDNEDHQKFLEVLWETKRKYGFELYAYCLMSNHVHILIKEIETDLAVIFKRIGASYVYWYNWKYSRIGHLFQGRFKSEVVETNKYFKTVLRYIHQNPLKAGIEKYLGTYQWSSYKEYTNTSRICDVGFTMNMFSNDQEEARRLFVEFNSKVNEEQCLGNDQYVRLNDNEASKFIKSISGVTSPTEVQNFEIQERNKVIKQCKDKGLSIRQIERLTGVSFGVVRKI